MFVGIDVSKEWVDVTVRPTGRTWQVDRSQKEVDLLVVKLKPKSPQLVVIEATGEYETSLVAALGVASVPVAVVDPRQVRDFARSQGILAKTDSVDDAAIAHFGKSAV